MKKYILSIAITACSLIASAQVTVQFKNMTGLPLIVHLVKLDVKDTLAAGTMGKIHQLPVISTNDLMFVTTTEDHRFYQVNMNRHHIDTTYTNGRFTFLLHYRPKGKVFYSRLKPLK